MSGGGGGGITQVTCRAIGRYSAKKSVCMVPCDHAEFEYSVSLSIRFAVPGASLFTTRRNSDGARQS